MKGEEKNENRIQCDDGENNTKQSNITDDEGLAKEFVLQTCGEGYDVQLTNCDDEFVSFFWK